MIGTTPTKTALLNSAFYFLFPIRLCVANNDFTLCTILPRQFSLGDDGAEDILMACCCCISTTRTLVAC